jgi:hypothetical protein
MGDDFTDVPSHTIEALDRYWTHGFSPGSFLSSLLCGNIYDAILRADPWNKQALGNIVEYIVHYAPRGSYGREDLYQDWINQGEFFQLHQKQRVVDYLSQP